MALRQSYKVMALRQSYKVMVLRQSYKVMALPQSYKFSHTVCIPIPNPNTLGNPTTSY
jgi:hypothetical protein